MRILSRDLSYIQREAEHALAGYEKERYERERTAKEYAMLFNKYADLKKQNADLKSEVDKLETKLQSEMVKHDQIAVDMSMGYEEKIQRLSGETKSLKDQLATSSNERNNVKSDLEAKHSAREEALQQHIKDLEKRHEEGVQWQSAQSREIQELEDQLASRIQHFQMSIVQDRGRSAQYIETLREKYETQLQAQEDQFYTKLEVQRAAMKDEKTREVGELRERLRQETEERERTIASLRAVADPGDQILQPTDNELKTLFQRLRLVIEMVTSPFNLPGATVPQNSPLDPSGFVEREGKNMMRHLLRSAIWARLLEGFFSAPYGFGAFGNGKGQQTLVGLYIAWRKVLAQDEGSAAADSVANADFTLFKRDKVANRWRSATFQSIVSALASNPSQSEDAVLTPFARNQTEVEQHIFSILQEVANVEAIDGVRETVAEIVRKAGELALQIGVHRASLGIALPRNGEPVKIGHEYIDCEEGDSAFGSVLDVDLAVSPLFYKIGDGRDDLLTVKPIVPGEIYPLPLRADDS